MKNNKKNRVVLKVTVKQFALILMNLKGYKFINLSYTTNLDKKMVKKDRQTGEANILINGQLKKVVNIASLYTSNTELSGYQNRAENNGKGAEYKEYSEGWHKFIGDNKLVATDKKTELKYYFCYEKINKTIVSEIWLNGAKFVGKIGDVWNKVSPNDRGVEIRLIEIKNIDKASIDGIRYEIIK
jgi:hypothetical protein